MAKEIERKFLIESEDYKQKETDIHKQHIKQGYFYDGVRVRTSIDGFGKHGFITFKSPNEGLIRNEYEYLIPYEEAKEILENICKGPIVEKIRHIVFNEDNRWEIDEFLGDNYGLTIAEIELDNEQQEFEKPSWLGKEITNKKKYYNSKLTKKPFKDWK
jgi:adenylate cyclase